MRSRKLIAGTMAADGRREDAIALLESTRATLDENDAPLASDLALRSASFMLLRDDPSEASRSLARLNPRDLGTEARAEFYRLRSEMHARAPGDDVAWRADAERAIKLYAKIGSARFEHFVRVQFGWQALARGDIRAARASLEAAERRSSESASTSNHLPISAAFVELAAGRLKAARAWLARVVAPQQLLERAFEAAARTEVALALDDVAELERWIDLSLIDELERADEPRSAFRLGTAFGCALVRVDQHHEADRVFERVAPLARTTFEIVPGVLALALFRPDLTASFLELLENGTTTPFLAAARSMLLAEAAREAGRPATAATLRSARDFYASADWIPLAARAAELEGDRATAAAWYREIGHVAGVRRLGLAAFRARRRKSASRRAGERFERSRARGGALYRERNVEPRSGGSPLTLREDDREAPLVDLSQARFTVARSARDVRCERASPYGFFPVTPARPSLRLSDGSGEGHPGATLVHDGSCPAVISS